MSLENGFPDLTPCFEHTVLIWISSFSLLLCVLYELISWLRQTTYLVTTPNTTEISWKVLGIQIVGSLLLILLDAPRAFYSFDVRLEEGATEKSTAEKVSFALRAINFVSF